MGVENRIVVDWGTSNFRAYRFSPDGGIAETHKAPAGILSVENGAFEDVLNREIGAWITPRSEILLSGMITSRNGWRETPYVEAPASLADLAAGAVDLRASNGAALRFLPGVCMRNPAPDVMRGEEIQVFGATTPEETVTLILPGTHSKWVEVERGRLASFRTFFTGEMFALLRNHSIIGRLASDQPPAPDAYLAGVRQAGALGGSGLLNDVFSVRAGALLGSVAPADVAERLSGLLIGHEITSALARRASSGPIRLVGDKALCARYHDALAALSVAAEFGPDHATVEGFRKLIAAKG